MSPTKFLKKKGLLLPGYKKYIITYTDGRKYDLVKLLQEYASLKNNVKLNSANPERSNKKC